MRRLAGASSCSGLDSGYTLRSFSQCFGGHEATSKKDERIDDAFVRRDDPSVHAITRSVCGEVKC